MQNSDNAEWGHSPIQRWSTTGRMTHVTGDRSIRTRPLWALRLCLVRIPRPDSLPESQNLNQRGTSLREILENQQILVVQIGSCPDPRFHCVRVQRKRRYLPNMPFSSGNWPVRFFFSPHPERLDLPLPFILIRPYQARADVTLGFLRPAAMVRGLASRLEHRPAAELPHAPLPSLAPFPSHPSRPRPLARASAPR